MFKLIVAICAAVPLTSAITLQCNFKISYEPEYESYGCIYPEFIFDGNLTHVLNVNGDHMNGMSNADVHHLLINDPQFQMLNIPQGISKFFPNLKIFAWYGSITTIHAGDLNFPDLFAIGIAFTKLVALDGDLFKYNPKLEFVGVFENPIEFVGDGLLDGSYGLKEADFGKNRCIDMRAETPREIQKLKFKLKEQCSGDRRPYEQQKSPINFLRKLFANKVASLSEKTVI